MYKKFILTVALIGAIVICGTSLAQNKSASAAHPAAKLAAKPATRATDKSAVTEDQKYAQVYASCTKEAELNEAKYDQLFDNCMEKNGFPQEEYETGGQPMRGVDDQDN
jgi:hypothetical protein